MALEAEEKSSKKPSLYERAVARLKNLRNQFSRPSIRLGYFDETLAVELHAINQRRRTRKDARHENHARP
jgi:hypothetical protein